MTLLTFTLICQLIALVCLLGTLVLLPFLFYYQWLTEHHLNRIREMQAGRSDPGPDPESFKHVKDQMAALKASERRWRGQVDA